jgi:hypothetical protein
VETFEAPDRPHIPFSGDERTQLAAWLDFYRGTLLEKCDGLTPAQMKERPVTTSLLSLLGMIRHMTFVEQAWFESAFAGHDVLEYYKTEGDRDADLKDLDRPAAEEVIDLYLRAIETSRQLAEGHDLNEMSKRPRRGRETDLRWTYIHMIEEYARHCGHADILRELIDGSTGY